jgi:hypothetical protein
MKNQESKKKVPEEILRDFFKVLGPKLPSMFDSVNVVWNDSWEHYYYLFTIKDSLKKRHPQMTTFTEYSLNKFLNTISDDDMAKEMLENDWIKKIENFYKDVRRYFHVPVSNGVYR